ncbi:MAG: dihydrodipicolinate synthase family protein [Syntrophales bacterium]|jgi:dihydrodipicolinate synthase/N-acetylneuraminate lyase|nr:dihydrodipicolinate synthase family protein [Syntrophales bacterium]MDY0043591.1 dihydrodipicolinate synthase family protein [Syntrophales bacterium]
MKEKASLRKELLQSLFPTGIPRLWCPLVTHYTEGGVIDFSRMAAQFHYVFPDAEGFLMPSSTGDGWKLDNEKTIQIVDFAVSMSQETGCHLLLAVLKPDAESTKNSIDAMLRFFREKTGIDDTAECLNAINVRGFAVCPPSECNDQEIIYKELSTVADLGIPIALYQIPFITRSEIAPSTFHALVEKYQNIFLLKDSSGNDLIARSFGHRKNVFLVRGAEGDYVKWLKDNGGPYDGFLLSTANSFAGELNVIIDYIERGAFPAADTLSHAISCVNKEINTLTNSLHSGNLFAATVKTVDHFYAFGPRAAGREGPLLHGGTRLPAEIITAAGQILKRYDLMPARGYLG